MQECEATQNDLRALEATLQDALTEAGHTLPTAPKPWLQEREGEWQHWQHTQAQLHNLAQAHTRQHALCDAAQTQANLWIKRWTELQASTSDQATELPAPPPMAATALPAALSACSDAITRLTQNIAALHGQQIQVQAALAQQRTALLDAQAAWHSALQHSPFADVSAFEAALLPEAERQRLTALKDQLQAALQRATALLQVARDKQTQLQNQALTTLPPEDIAAQLVALEAQRSALSEQIGAQRALLAKDDTLRTNQQALFEQIGLQSEDADIWQRLDGLIGSAKGDKFRKFAQGLTLDHLLHLANRHLARLHGRYLLRRKVTGELELDIVDAWQGDTTRDTRTLSGGEGFLVSLALALALSDLVSNKTSIDSLFLDEGFGSLDGDTLEVALTALDSLNASGKMIGVISHVEAMKERIPAQIRVEKGGVGHSRLVV